MQRILLPLLTLALMANLSFVLAAESDEPKPIPQSRPEIKRLLEALKSRTPRLPLPAATDEEIAAAKAAGRFLVNNGRTRAIYLPATWFSATAAGQTDPRMTLDYVFKTECFWIVSRGNNCHYCLGHQEHKLSDSGLTDDQIALLDADWSSFKPGEQAAFALTKKMTLTPHLVSAEDINSLRDHFTDAQIVELVYTIAGFNSTNRWTDAMGIPQDQQFREHAVRFDQPTSPQFEKADCLAKPEPLAKRPALETPAQAAEAIAACRSRKCRVAMPDEAAIGELQTAAGLAGTAPNWAQVLAYFPQTGGRQVVTWQTMTTDDNLEPRLKAAISWTTARHNRAWYALAHAQRRLAANGLADDKCFALDEPSGANLSAGEVDALKFAHKLTVTPQRITDADIARLREHFGDKGTAQIVHVTSASNMFDRLTETLGLPLED